MQSVSPPTPLAAAMAVLTPIVLGVILGLASRRLIHHGPLRAKLSALLNDLALKILLPFFVIESMAKVDFSASLLVAIGIGYALPLLTLCGMRLVRIALLDKTRLPKNFADLGFIAATFGGGSRGTALLVLLFASSSDFAEYLKWFALVDFGNFLCLLTAITYLMRRHYGGAKTGPVAGAWWRALSRNYAFVALSVAAIYFALRAYFPVVESALEATVHPRRLLFSVLVFWAITLQFKANAARGLLGDAVALSLGRALAAAVAILPLVFLLPGSGPLLVATAILLLMPPSSLAPAMIANAGASRSVSEYVSSFTGAANLSYVVMVALGLVLLFAHAR